MEATFLHGDPLMIDYTPVSAVAAGEVVVVGSLALIPHSPIAADALGAVAAGRGVYTVAKATGAINPGQRLWWNATNNNVQTGPTGVIFGYAGTEGAESGDTTVDAIHDPQMDNAGT